MVDLIEGEVEVFGARVKPRRRLRVPEGRSLPIESTHDSFLRVVGGSWSIEEGSLIPPGWRSLVREVRSKRVVMLLGENDTGKSSLTLYLANKLLDAGCSPAIVDSDIGQSDVGPTGTIGLARLEAPSPVYSALSLMDAYFIGDKSPVGHLLPMVVGTAKMVRAGLEGGATNVLVNTSGLVRGGVGWALKYYKVQSVNPGLVIAVQKSNELNHILRGVEVDYVTISPPPVVKKSVGERIAYRASALGTYLSNSRRVEIPVGSVKLVNTRLYNEQRDPELEGVVRELLGEPPIRVEKGPDGVLVVVGDELEREVFQSLRRLLSSASPNVHIVAEGRVRGLYLGIYDEHDKFAGVGRLLGFSREEDKLFLETNVSQDKISKLVFGYLIIGERGDEEGALKPGYL